MGEIQSPNGYQYGHQWRGLSSSGSGNWECAYCGLHVSGGPHDGGPYFPGRKQIVRSCIYAAVTKTEHSCLLDRFDVDGMKIVTSDAGLASLSDARIKLAGVEETFPVDWMDIKDGIPTVHFGLPAGIDFSAFMGPSIEWFPDTGRIRTFYFLRRLAVIT